MNDILERFDYYLRQKTDFFENHELDEGPMLLRKLAKTSRVMPSMRLFSNKNGCLNRADSQMEMDQGLIWEFDDSVKAYLMQPFSSMVMVNNKRVRNTFDTLIELNDGTFALIEVKRSEQLLKPKVAAKQEAVEKYCTENFKVPYCILTEEHIYKEKLIDNLQQLYPFKSMHPPKSLVSSVRSGFKKDCTIETLEAFCKKLNFTINDAWSLIANGIFTFDATECLTKQSTVYLTH
jgi:hypothetical protein